MSIPNALAGPGSPNDTSTTLSKGSQDGDTFDESNVYNASLALVKRERVVLGDDVGNIVNQFSLGSEGTYEVPVQTDLETRRAAEMTAYVATMSAMNAGLDLRDADKFMSAGMRGKEMR